MTISTSTSNIISAWTSDGIGKALGVPDYPALAHLIYPQPKYRVFSLKKKDGSFRTIASPSPKTKMVQRRLANALNELDASRPSVHGFRRDRSVATNAKAHAFGKERKTFVFNIDLKDFFSSISFKRVRGIFRAPPFNFSFEKATIFAQLCCYGGALPQGAPTSPALSNYACRGMDGALQRLARDARATYSRYADDITFSFSCKSADDLPEGIVEISGGVPSVGAKLLKIIDESGFIVNESKVRLRSKHQRMEVTGLAINDIPNVRRVFVDEIRGALHAWKTHGLLKAQEKFEERKYRRSTRTGQHPDLAKYIRGKLLYLNMVKGHSDRVYVRLAREFNSCLFLTKGCTVKALKTQPTVIDTAELEKAVFLFSARDSKNETKSTAFFLENVGIVTCDHCLCDEFGKYFDPHGEFFLQDIFETDLAELEIRWRDKDADIAVMWFKEPAFLPHLWLPASPVDVIVGDSVDLVGYPAFSAAKPMTITPARVLQKFVKWTRRHLDINALIRQGNSGGPVIDKDLRVVGLAKEGATQDKGNNGVLTTAEITALHQAHFVGPPKAP